MPAVVSVSKREPARTWSDTATAGTAGFSRTSTVIPFGRTCRRHVLPNGMTVLVRENPAVPAVAVSLQVRAGSRFETETTAGITNFLHRAMLRGTAKRTAEQFATSYEDIGGTLDAGGEVEAAEVRGQTLARNWTT